MSTIALKNNIVGLKDLRLNLEKYIKRVNKGESFTVIRRSKPVFKIAPIDEEDMWETLVDFTEISKNGISGRKLLKILKKIDG